MSNLSQFGFGGGIKSIQRGIITLSGGTLGGGTSSSTISSVNTDKSILYLLGYSTASTNTIQDDGINRMAYLTLTNSTTITASGADNTFSVYYHPLYVSWQLVEYY